MLRSLTLPRAAIGWSVICVCGIPMTNSLICIGVQEKKLHHSCENEIEKSVPSDHSLASLVMPYCDPLDGSFYSIHTLMKVFDNLLSTSHTLRCYLHIIKFLNTDVNPLPHREAF